MNHRNIQTFLMVSAAFFAMSAPLRSNASSNEGGNNAFANATARMATRCAPAQVGTRRFGASAQSSDGSEQS